MSWQNELRPVIKFTSPQGSKFTALWRNNERTTEKKLGIFDIPKFQGTIIQDMGIKSTSYPLTFYFDGINHHTESERFSTSCGEYGQWTVIHPVKGPLVLQLVDWTENIAPVDNGSYTEFTSNWILPANIERIISADELATSTLAKTLNSIEDAQTSFQQLRADAYAAVQAAVNVLNKIGGLSNTILGELAATSAITQDSYESANQSFRNAVDAFGVDSPDAGPVAVALIDLFLSTVEVNTDYSGRFSSYSDMLDAAIGERPVSNTVEDYNRALSAELAIIGVLIAIAQVIITSEFTTRREVVSAMDNITEVFSRAVSSIEQTQDIFSVLSLDRQFYALIKVYTNIIDLYSTVMKYLITQFYSLRTEKRFTLKNDRSPLEITVTEYGSLGNADSNYDLFLTSNRLSGKDIIQLPAGQEVVIYVG